MIKSYSELYAEQVKVTQQQAKRIQELEYIKDGTVLFLRELNDYINSGISKNDTKTLIKQRIKQLLSK